jgi:hypothetical protein
MKPDMQRIDDWQLLEKQTGLKHELKTQGAKIGYNGLTRRVSDCEQLKMNWPYSQDMRLHDKKEAVASRFAKQLYEGRIWTKQQAEENCAKEGLELCSKSEVLALNKCALGWTKESAGYPMADGEGFYQQKSQSADPEVRKQKGWCGGNKNGWRPGPQTDPKAGAFCCHEQPKPGIEHDVQSLDECAQLCRDDSECGAYSFNNKDNSCTTFEKNAYKYVDSNDHVSANKRAFGQDKVAGQWLTNACLHGQNTDPGAQPKIKSIALSNHAGHAALKLKAERAAARLPTRSELLKSGLNAGNQDVWHPTNDGDWAQIGKHGNKRCDRYCLHKQVFGTARWDSTGHGHASVGAKRPNGYQRYKWLHVVDVPGCERFNNVSSNRGVNYWSRVACQHGVKLRHQQKAAANDILHGR